MPPDSRPPSKIPPDPASLCTTTTPRPPHDRHADRPTTATAHRDDRGRPVGARLPPGQAGGEAAVKLGLGQLDLHRDGVARVEHQLGDVLGRPQVVLDQADGLERRRRPG